MSLMSSFLFSPAINSENIEQLCYTPTEYGFNLNVKAVGEDIRIDDECRPQTFYTSALSKDEKRAQ